MRLQQGLWARLRAENRSKQTSIRTRLGFALLIEQPVKANELLVENHG
jgi:hypothetical protein